MNHLKIFEEFNYDKLILEIKTFELKKNIQYGKVPLTTTVIKKIFGKLNRIQSFHITDKTHIDDILNIIGKRNPISTFTYCSPEFLEKLNGISTKGGILMRIEGDINFMSFRDIFSYPDESLKRRWIDSKQLSKSLKRDLMDFIKNQKIDQLEIDKKTINIYMSNVYELIDKYKSEIINTILNPNLHHLFTSNNYTLNEIIVSNIKVLDIAFYPKKIFTECEDDSERCQILIKNLQEKLNKLSPNKVQIIENQYEINKWFKDRGGLSNYEDYQTYLKSTFG